MHFDDPRAAPSRHSIALPFVVRPATSAADLRKVTQMRVEAYGPHLPAFAATLRAIEDADRSPGAVVLLAVSKNDGRPVGTVRLQIGLEGPLPIESSVRLPAWLREAGALIEPTRLGVEAGERGALARNALLKACYLYSAAADAA